MHARNDTIRIDCYDESRNDVSTRKNEFSNDGNIDSVYDLPVESGTLIPTGGEKVIETAKTDVTVLPPDETPPPTKDQPNRTIVILMAIGFFLVACVLLALFPLAPSWLLVTLFFFPPLGVLLYLIAVRYRRKLVTLQMAGALGGKHKLSAHYHRFKIFLMLFFSSALLGWLGYALIYSTAWGAAPILGLFGVFMFGAGTGFTIVLAGVLMVMFIAYLIKWKDDPTGVAKKREPRPVKGQ